jgi:hypothetical protein
LIDLAEWEKVWYEQSKSWRAQFNAMFLYCPIKTVPRLDFSSATNITSLFQNSSIESVDYYLNCGQSQTCTNLFSGCQSLKFVYGLDLGKGVNLSYIFKNCVLLETIQEPLNFSSATNTKEIFYGCIALKNARFKENSIKVSITIPSPVLSAESVQSIFDGLAPVETAQTLTLDANLKILQSQVNSANAKGWTIAGGTVVSEEEYYG